MRLLRGAVDLLDQRAEALDQRQAGADQGRELPRHQRQVLRRDALEQSGEVEAEPARASACRRRLLARASSFRSVGKIPIAAQLDARALRAVGVDDAADVAALARSAPCTRRPA